MSVLNLRDAKRLWVGQSEAQRLWIGGAEWSKPTDAVFSPADLFTGVDLGAWFDPSDMSTLFQDAEGTIPVTAPGQPVGLMLAKAGSVLHTHQPIAAARPTLMSDGARYWLEFDGIDDVMVAAIGSSANTPWTYAKSADRGAPEPFTRSLFLKSDNAYLAYELYCSTGSRGRLRLENADGHILTPNLTTYEAGIPVVIAAEIDVVGSATTTMRIGSGASAPVDSLIPEGTASGWSYELGQLLPGNRVYAEVLINRKLSPAEMTLLTDFLADRAGITP